MDIITDCVQGDKRWFQLCCGSIGGSGIKKVIAKGEYKTRTKYLYQKADENLTKIPSDSYQNQDMIFGSESEPYSRDMYSLLYGVEVEQVAIIKESKFKHVSLDGQVGEDGTIEIKQINGPDYIEAIIKDKFLVKHKPQVQWGLGISRRKWCDFILACWMRDGSGEIVPRYPNRPIWVKRVYRDEEYIKMLNEEADKFLMEMATVIRKIKEA